MRAATMSSPSSRASSTRTGLPGTLKYVIEHGWKPLLSQPATVGCLGQLLATYNDQYQQTDKQLSWGEFSAAAIAGALG